MHDEARDAVTHGAPAGWRALVVCIGNSLVADDAAGGEVHRALASAELPPGVTLRWLATGGMNLVDELAGEDLLIVVDAVQLGAAPGTVHVKRWTDLPAPDGAVSAHGIGVREAVEVTRLLFPERAPRDALLVGIEGRQFDRLGEPMSPQVADAIPRAVAQVLALLADESS